LNLPISLIGEVDRYKEAKGISASVAGQQLLSLGLGIAADIEKAKHQERLAEAQLEAARIRSAHPVRADL